MPLSCVGTGNAASYLPHLVEKGISKLYFVDVSAFVLNWVKSTFDLFCTSETLAEFRGKCFDPDHHPGVSLLLAAYAREGLPAKLLLAKFRDEVDEMGKYHFTRSETNYRNAKAAMSVCNYELLEINLFDNASMQAFKTKLEEKDEVISFANFTNVGMWAIKDNKLEAFSANLKGLPWDVQPLIVSGFETTIYKDNDTYCEQLALASALSQTKTYSKQ